MIPIVWRYLLSQYFKIFAVSAGAFVSVLFTARLRDIAHFASLGADKWMTLQFIFYQVPYLLPVVITVSSLLAAMILTQRLSRTGELTAFRMCGLALKDILLPLLLGAVALSLVTFYIVSEIATVTHLKANLLKNTVRSFNPISVLKNRAFRQAKGIYFDVLGSSKKSHPLDAVFASSDKTDGRILLVIAKELETKESSLSGKGITCIKTLQKVEENPSETFESLMVENISSTTLQKDAFLDFFQAKTHSIRDDLLSFSLLMSKLKKLPQGMRQKGFSEMIRRFSIALGTITFMLMGCAYGIQYNGKKAFGQLFQVLLLTSLTLFCYLLAKGNERVAPSFALYFFPQLLILAFSSRAFFRFAKGLL